jgi:hypothetical protein
MWRVQAYLLDMLAAARDGTGQLRPVDAPELVNGRGGRSTPNSWQSENVQQTGVSRVIH